VLEFINQNPSKIVSKVIKQFFKTSYRIYYFSLLSVNMEQYKPEESVRREQQEPNDTVRKTGLVCIEGRYLDPKDPSDLREIREAVARYADWS
jgi:hypothetical protein